MSTQKTLGALSNGASKISDGVAKQTLKSGGALNKKVNNLVNRTSPVVGQNTKGDLDVGLRVLGSGVSVSNKGDITLGFGGVSITFDPFNADTSNVIDFGLGKVTIETTQDGCTITVTTRIGGKIADQQTRQADDCKEPEPTPTPTPTPSPSPGGEPDTAPKISGFTPKSPPPCFSGKLYKHFRRQIFFVYYTYTWVEPEGHAFAGQTFTDSYDIYNGGYVNELDFGRYPTYEEVDHTYNYWAEQFNAIQFDVQDFELGGFTNPETGESFENTNTYKLRKYRFDCVSVILPGLPTSDPETYNKWYKDIVAPANCSPYNPKPRGIMSEDKECDCELLEDIYDMLGGDDFKDDGLEIPNHLFIPGGQGETKAMTYNALLNLMFRTLDHRTVGEVEVSIKDNNIMKEGDQPLTMKLVNATAATGKILELSQKQDSDLTAVLNLLMRLSWISVQILKVVNIGSEATKTIVSFFAIPVKEKVINVDIPVDPSLGGKIGFDPKKPSEDQLIKILDLDDPQKTISIFDKFMNNSKIPVKVKQFIGDRSGGNYWWLMDKNKK